MLIKFAVTNYRGFAERIEWDLSHPSNYSHNNFAIKNNIVKNGIMYGHNGSGKSNLALAIFDIANHLSHKWKKHDYYVNFANAGKINDPVEFEYTFRFGDAVVRYSYSKIIRERKVLILREQLVLNDERELLYKDENAVRVADDFAISEVAKENLRGSANNISLINYLLLSVPLQEGHVLLRLRDFVENMLFFRSLDNREFIGLKESSNSNIEEYIIENGLVEEFREFLKDISNQEFRFVQPVVGDKMLFCQFGENRIPFVLIASTGTLNLELQFYWFCEMRSASFVFVDEFDAFYHYELSYSLCKKLFESDAQLFLSTHDTFLLSNDLLRPDCFFILNDNKIAALCDMTEKELRFGHNLEKLYRGGTFGV